MKKSVEDDVAQDKAELVQMLELQRLATAEAIETGKPEAIKRAARSPSSGGVP